jgi:hypothetical protein|tara:strand:+ start:1747 stop:4008 length:2262 start_codon:yes stop_codon:yes gene_type:complete
MSVDLFHKQKTSFFDKKRNLFHFNNLIFYFFLIIINSCDLKNNKVDRYRAASGTQATFVGSQSCRSCHEKEYSLWENSHHDQAMKIADSLTVLANFNNTSFTHNTVTSTFYKKDGAFYVNTEGPDGKYSDYKIIYTFGFTPLQQYIVQFPDGKYQCLSIAWDSIKNNWFHLQPDLIIKHNEWMHWTGGSMNWNTMCADCHSTNVHKNFDSKSDSYKTTFSEINVSCEACHGPSSEHTAFYKKENQGGTPPQMYMGKNMSSTELVEKCARCHSRRSQYTDYFDYEGYYLDHYEPSLLIDPIYELDGQIRDEDYVYASFLQTKMYKEGISCKDCHDVHSLELIKTGNALCLNCHTSQYNSPSHHYHIPNTESSKCINCHMTGRYYMGNDFRRDHSFRVPRPDQTEQYNTPNACNSCHKDKSSKWASDFIKEKYGNKRADHFSDHLLKGYFEDKSGFETVFSNKDYPEIARATAINQFINQQVPEKDVHKLIPYLGDTSALVRTETVRAIEKTGITNFSNNIIPLLNDSIRIVRISAARYFHMTGMDMSENIDFSKANKEYLKQLNSNLDFASGHHQKAVYYQAENNTELAIKSYEKSLGIDNYYNASRMNLALLYYETGRMEECEQLYLKVIEQEPDFSFSYYMLGLLYNETGNNSNALKYLALAIDKEPTTSNSFYNYALKLQEIEQYDKSVQVLDKGLKIFFNNERLLYVKLIGQLKSANTIAAYNTCLKLLEISPNNTNYLQIFQGIQEKIE